MRSIILTFHEGTRRTDFNLDGTQGLYAQTALNLRGYSSDYTLDSNTLSAIHHPARETTLDIKAHRQQGRESLRQLLALASRTLDRNDATLTVDGWRQRVRIPKMEAKEVNLAVDTATLTMALLDGWWMKDSPTITISQASVKDTMLDHPYDHEYDHQSLSSLIAFGGTDDEKDAYDTLITLRIQGPASHPAITIDTNTYAVDCDIPDGAYLTIDPINRTTILTQQDGTTSNAFAQARRGNGQNSGTYIFQPLHPQTHTIANTRQLTLSITPTHRRQHAW